ncbi:MAG TPA: gamma-glutamyl-gamma-aminobutyrate hydrolase family protein [Pyrinomonadaceae bacterium]|nr:gamma-glutamyl-gamma-aminobutyrate hydrolase family protein [Pyrinomonadaceae bacterium]
MSNRTKIGITMRLEIETRRFYLGRDYSEAIEAAGGDPVHIGLIPRREYIESTLKDLDGILLPGSDTDVDPQYYGEEPHRNLKRVVPEKDETERLVIEVAEKLHLPMLAICYGMQALNVARGGSLVQDIDSQIADPIKHEQGMPLARGSHTITYAPNWLLGETADHLTSRSSIRVNSHHHQAIGRIGDGLEAVAFAPDGIVESVQDTRSGRFVLGVQWHPELSWASDELSRMIFERFVANCHNREASFADGR